MLALAKRLFAYSRSAGESLNAVRAVGRWDVGGAADDLRALVLQLEEEGNEGMAIRLESIEQTIRQLSDILVAESKYGERLLAELDQDLMIVHGVPIDEAVDVALAYEEVSGMLRDLLDYGPIADRARVDERVGRLLDESSESLQALRAAIDSTFDTGRSSAVLDAKADSLLYPPAEWETELEQNGLEVISLEEFVESYGMEDVEFFPLEPELEWDDPDSHADLAETIQARFASLDDALTALINELPDGDSYYDTIDASIDSVYRSVDELEDLVLH